MNHRCKYNSIVVLCCWLAAVSAASGRSAAADDAVAAQIAIIAKVGPQGAGSAAARTARDELARRGVEILPQLLAAMNTSNVVAANWYRSIYEELVERGLAQKETVWPTAFFKEYVSEVRNAGRPRTLVLALLDRLEPAYREHWLPTRLDDPDFRNGAVALVPPLASRTRDGNNNQAKSGISQGVRPGPRQQPGGAGGAKLKALASRPTSRASGSGHELVAGGSLTLRKDRIRVKPSARVEVDLGPRTGQGTKDTLD